MIESTNTLKDLQGAIDFIAAKFVFDVASYPLIAKLSPEEKLQFSVNHSLQHMTKQLGKIAAHLEDKDHGGVGNPEALREALVKSFTNVLRLAELLDMNAEMLLAEVPKHMK
jgi:hypothetical protein